jgi:anti-sigma factor RsiW
MNCWRVQNLIAPLLDNELPAGESEAVADHLEQCPPCRGVVESVAALPEFPQLKLDADIESSLWAEFDRCLAARTADPAEREAGAAPSPTRFTPLQGDLRVPRSLAAAAIAAVVMLAGWNWTTYQRLDRLESSVGERDAIIVALQERVADQREVRSAFALGADPTENLPVLLPANAPVPTVVGSTRLPSPYRTVDYRVAVGSNPTLTR